MALLELSDLRVHYGKALALDGLDISVDAGELVCVLGPNGAGKTTLLKAVSGAVPHTGKIVFAGAPLENLAAHQVVAHGICHCPEGRLLFPAMSVRENLMLGAFLPGRASR